MRASQAFLRWCRAGAPEPRHSEIKKLRRSHGRAGNGSKLFTVVRDGVEIDWIPPFSITAAKRQYTLSNLSECSALELIVRTDTEKEPVHDVLPSEA